VNATRIFRYFLTLLLLGAALWMGRAAWDHYMASAWTRDGRIKADVVTISADVAGTVTQVLVHDNQLVQRATSCSPSIRRATAMPSRRHRPCRQRSRWNGAGAAGGQPACSAG
jgi:hypothetical protein